MVLPHPTQSQEIAMHTAAALHALPSTEQKKDYLAELGAFLERIRLAASRSAPTRPIAFLVTVAQRILADAILDDDSDQRRARIRVARRAKVEEVLTA